jgi:hypothetical protein
MYISRLNNSIYKTIFDRSLLYLLSILNTDVSTLCHDRYFRYFKTTSLGFGTVSDYVVEVGIRLFSDIL